MWKKRKHLNFNTAIFLFRGGEQLPKKLVETPNGTALDVYHFMLTHNRPVGVRELARELNFSSPSVAQHHLTRLENMGLIKREWGNYAVNKVILQNHVKINRFLIPRYLFYLIFAIIALLVEIMFYSTLLVQAHAIVLIIQIIVIGIFAYETSRIWHKK